MTNDAPLDLNCDAGEDAALVDSGQRALLALCTRANVACGGHAGDARTMRATVEQCRAHGVSIGGHPSYPDRDGFGRTSMAMAPGALERALSAQLSALLDVVGAPLAHAKPHGALYHDIVVDEAKRAAFAAAVRAAGCTVVIVDPHTPSMPGLTSLREGFVDRAYDGDRLRPRDRPGALLDVDAAVAQALALWGSRRFDTLCVHSDTPDALRIARAVRASCR